MTKRPCFVFSGSRVLINHHRCILARPERSFLITNKLNNHLMVIIKTKHTFLSRNVIKTHLNGGSISKYYIFHRVYLCHVVLFCWHNFGSFCIWQNLLNIHEEFKSRPMALWYINKMTTTNPKWFVDISDISKMGNYIFTSHNPFTTGGNWIVGFRNRYSYEWKMIY